MNLEDKEPAKTSRIAVMGLSGTGKSTLVSKLAESYTLHWITLDNDADILFKLPREWWKNVQLYDIPDSATFPVAADTLLKLFKTKKADICHAHGVISCAICKKNEGKSSLLDFTVMDPKKDVVVIDTGSQLAMSILAHATKGQAVDYKPERDDWGGIRKWTEFFCSEFQAARFNLVVIFHAIEATLEDDRVKLVPSFGSKDMSSKVAKAFSHVVYTDIKNKKHVAFSSSVYANNVLTKSRTDFEIEKLGEPSLIPIFSGVVPETKKEDPKASASTPATVSASTLQAMKDRLQKKG